MKNVSLSTVLPGAPDTPSAHIYDISEVIACKAKGAARNVLYFDSTVAAFSFEADPYFPPEGQHCDWCVVTRSDLDVHFVELKGSDLKEALQQLHSTIHYLTGRWGLKPKKAYVVISGQHPKIPKAGRPFLHAQFRKVSRIDFQECSAGQRMPLSI